MSAVNQSSVHDSEIDRQLDELLTSIPGSIAGNHLLQTMDVESQNPAPNHISIGAETEIPSNSLSSRFLIL